MSLGIDAVVRAVLRCSRETRLVIGIDDAHSLRVDARCGELGMTQCVDVVRIKHEKRGDATSFAIERVLRELLGSRDLPSPREHDDAYDYDVDPFYLSADELASRMIIDTCPVRSVELSVLSRDEITSGEMPTLRVIAAGREVAYSLVVDEKHASFVGAFLRQLTTRSPRKS